MVVKQQYDSASYLDWPLAPSSQKEPRLQDAQGAPIAICGRKQVCFIFHTDGDKEVQIYDKAHVSDEISQPIISYICEVDGSRLELRLVALMGANML